MVRELLEHGILAEVDRADGRWKVMVPRRDHSLSEGLMGLGVPTASRVRARRQPLTILAVALVSFVAGTFFSSSQETDAYRATNDGRIAQSDDDGDGRFDRAVIMAGNGRPTSVWFDDDHDGVFDRFQQLGLDSGRLVEIADEDGDGFPETRNR